jgi:hypothetical protein
MAKSDYIWFAREKPIWIRTYQRKHPKTIAISCRSAPLIAPLAWNSFRSWRHL